MTRENPVSSGSILREGHSCWRKVRASRVAFLMDVKEHFDCTFEVFSKARKSIYILGWDFDPRTTLAPDGISKRGTSHLGSFLNGLKRANPALEIRILIWDMALPLVLFREFSPRQAHAWLDEGIAFRLDSPPAIGATHHQKIVVVDDEIAFCSGCDFAANRWDVPSHPDRLRYRLLPSGEAYKPRHEVTMMLDGEVARALGGLVRERWRKASGEILIAPTEPVGSRVDLWPDICTPALRNLHVAIMRTEPYWLSQPEIRENEAAYLDAIAAAKKLIYLENQYFASAVVGDALAARLGEAEGPEIVVICAARAPSFFDKLAMDSARNALLRRLRAADHHGRLQVYRPRTKGGRTIILHSKVACFDERLIRIGSSNLNNRSFGYDSECDIAIEVGASQPAETGPAIAAFRDELIGHFLGLRGEDFARAYEQEGSAIKAIAKLNHPRKPRLKIIRNRPLSFLSSLIARWHLGDPAGVRDAWRPWRRVAYFRQRRLTKS